MPPLKASIAKSVFITNRAIRVRCGKIERLIDGANRFAIFIRIRDNARRRRGTPSAEAEQMPLEEQASKFEIGEVVATPAALAALQAIGQTLPNLLARHQAGDWGDVADQVRSVNERGLVECFNLQSAYAVNRGQRLVVVTNGERTVTMIHLDHRVE